MTDTASLGTGSSGSRDDAIAIPIPTPVFAPARFESGGCQICGQAPVLWVGGDGVTIALCPPHAEAVWQQLTGAIEAGVTVQPLPLEQTPPAARTHWCHECESDVAADHEHEGQPGQKGPVVEPLRSATQPESPEVTAQRPCHDEAGGTVTVGRQPTNESELRRQLRGRRVLVCVSVGDATELVETTIDEGVWLWRLAQERGSPSRVHMDDDDLETLDFAVLDFRGQPAASAECDAVESAPDVAGVDTRRASMRQ